MLGGPGLTLGHHKSMRLNLAGYFGILARRAVTLPRTIPYN